VGRISWIRATTFVDFKSDFTFFIILLFYFRILALEKLGAVFNQVSHPLPYTPRKFVIHPESGHLVTIETDHNSYTEATKAQRKQTLADVSFP